VKYFLILHAKQTGYDAKKPDLWKSSVASQLPDSKEVTDIKENDTLLTLTKSIKDTMIVTIIKDEEWTQQISVIMSVMSIRH
jgi:hypothetical protein